MTEKVTTASQWLFKQVPVVILLIGTNIAQYNYFTKQIEKLENKVEKLQDKLIKQ
jgi:hypothetical protein